MAYITKRLVKLCKIYCDIWHRLTWSVCTGGRAGVRYVITKFSRMDSLPNFLTHGAPLRVRFGRAGAALWELPSFAAQTQSFVCGKFSTARLEVLPNLRHALGVFQMSTMVNLGIGLTRRWAFTTPQHHGEYTNSSSLESDLKVRKYHAMLFLKTCMS